MNYAQIGSRIRRLRRERGLTQETLAEMVDISTTHMSHIETGATKLSLPVLVDIAQALDVSCDVILTGSRSNTGNGAVQEAQALLSDCTPKQAQVLLAILRASYTALKQTSD